MNGGLRARGRETERQLLALSGRALPGLPNRRKMTERVSAVAARAKPAADRHHAAPLLDHPGLSRTSRKRVHACGSAIPLPRQTPAPPHAIAPTRLFGPQKSD